MLLLQSDLLNPVPFNVMVVSLVPLLGDMLYNLTRSSAQASISLTVAMAGQDISSGVQVPA